MGTDDEQRSLVPHMQPAAELRRSLTAIAIARGVIDALGIPVFLMGSDGRVTTMTALAEEMLSEGKVLMLRYGKIEAVHPASNVRLQRALRLACGALPRTASRLLLEGAVGPLAADVAPLSEESGALRSGATAALAFPGFRRPGEPKTAILQANFALSRAEAEVALQLVKAQTPGAIAASRGVALSTVRQQIKHLYTKSGVNSRAGLIRAIGVLLGPDSA
jgi:DNA-binding CsgD family transcriptional regulator